VLRGILTATGAREAVEHRISAGVERAERALQSAPIRSDALTALLELAHAAAHRSF
jgi:geranylgeranyl pyrophosphate synthase